VSEHPEQKDQSDAPAAAAGATSSDSSRGGPEPEGIVLFGTAWVSHDRRYALRRVGAAVGSLVATAAACLVLRFAYQGLQIADVGALVGDLVIVMFAVCSVIAFHRTWQGFRRRPADPAREESLRTIKMIGFVGSLLAYFVRSLAEAPGERLRRTEYETAVVQYERRRTARAGNPAARRRGKGKKPTR
jgi:hypothetical protein